MSLEPNSPNSEPNPSPALQVTPTPPISSDPAENYILTEIKNTRAGLKRTQIIGTIVLLLIGIQLGYITMHFRESLQPHVAAEIADGMIMQQVNDRGPDFAAQIKQKIPEYLAQTPDYVLQQLPVYREGVEDKVEKTLTQYCEKTSQQLSQHVDTYLDTRKDQIKGMLTTPNDPAALQQSGQDLKQELLGYLKEKPASGESIQDQVNLTLASLQDFEKKMHRLAANKGLTPQEKKTRQVIAILSRSINDQKLDQKALGLMSDVKTAGSNLRTAAEQKLGK